MSAEDETFDFDLYGDDEQPEESPQIQSELPTTEKDQGSSNASKQSSDIANATQSTVAPSKDGTRSQPNSTLPTQTQGTKRKVREDDDEESLPPRKPQQPQRDERVLEQGAQVSLKLAELQWWITEEDLREYCVRANVEEELVELAFGEHKSNGKSKGEAYLEFESPQAAGMVKRELEKANTEISATSKIGSGLGKSRVSVWYTHPGNPFRARDGVGKKDVGGSSGSSSRYHTGQQSGYNQYPSQNRGGYGGGRGRGGFGGRGGNASGGQWGNQNQGNHNTFNNPMMAGFNNMGFGGFGNMAMNPNAMMNSMMGMAGMGMNFQNMMGNRGGGNNMMGRGGRGGNMSNGSSQQQGDYNQGWDNKKPRRE